MYSASLAHEMIAHRCAQLMARPPKIEADFGHLIDTVAVRESSEVGLTQAARPDATPKSIELAGPWNVQSLEVGGRHFGSFCRPT